MSIGSEGARVEEIAQQTGSAVAETFAEARERYMPLVFAYVSRRVKPVEEAEDVTAEVFVDAFRHWNRRRGEARLWLLGIARRKVADSYRRRKRALRIRRDEEPTADAMAEFEGNYESRQAVAVLLALPDDERDALAMQILEDLSITEIAAVLGRSYAATNSLLQRARDRVHKLTEKMT
jgi:RNA polymerase sigma-70 factor (ECF subfamily)